MSEVIWKYYLSPATLPTADIELALPSTAEILSVNEQAGQLVLWAKLDPSHAISSPRHFAALYTGVDIPGGLSSGGMRFIGTVQASNGLVFHIFELEVE